ncbi:hypothetical protein ACJRO7_033583 [Eucalyptus globulus]|uniref:Uncharacterized protein n=1 Tax=Eucalyptus globulus TaxID=34317 RepID=A0ABD3JN52_EUCGL
MACMQEEKEPAVRSREVLLLPPRRGRIKRLLFARLFRSIRALVAKILGSLLGRDSTPAPTSPLVSSLTR